jgi:hypothetical protein
LEEKEMTIDRERERKRAGEDKGGERESGGKQMKRRRQESK